MKISLMFLLDITTCSHEAWSSDARLGSCGKETWSDEGIESEEEAESEKETWSEMVMIPRWRTLLVLYEI
jgi:hypothetical protein